MNWSGKVLLWEEYGLFLGAAGSAEMHESPAIKICIALNDHFELRAPEDNSWQKHTSAVIPAGLAHAIEGHRNKMAMFLLAPEGKLGQQLITVTNENDITVISTDILQSLSPLLSVFDNADRNDDYAYAQAYVKIVSIIGSDTITIDPRVAQSIEWIRAGRENGFLVKDIAAEVDLSESRFSHLFTEHVRIPVRRYLLWLRLRDALHMLAGGGSLTETAHSAGFADSSHLTRTFRTSLGIAPSALVRDSSLVSFL